MVAFERGHITVESLIDGPPEIAEIVFRHVQSRASEAESAAVRAALDGVA